MKKLYTLGLAILLVTSCKNETTKPQKIDEEVTKTATELIAEAHGFANWHRVSEINFTFSVDRDSIKGQGRAWSWKPKKDSVMLTMPNKIVRYSQRNLDSLALQADPAFINDKFWLLIPFQLVWDKGTSISEATKETAPVSGSTLNKITTTYTHEGGYTPGDAYDIYFDDNYIIREWTFRKANSPEPTLSTTFEDYENFNGLLLATSHKTKEPGFNLRFSNVSVTLK
jgi:hypothetical protein